MGGTLEGRNTWGWLMFGHCDVVMHRASSVMGCGSNATGTGREWYKEGGDLVLSRGPAGVMEVVPVIGKQQNHSTWY